MSRLRYARLLVLPALVVGVTCYLAQAAQDDRRIEPNQVFDTLYLDALEVPEPDARQDQAAADRSDL